MSFKLLPRSTEEFSDVKFWEGFFKTRGSKAFEWYGEYQDMLDLWAQYVKSGDRVLNIGCGNSELGVELHDRQGCEVLCVDTSATVVQQMSRKHCSGGRRPRLAYRVMDAARLEGLTDGEFACAVDKGTLDALMSSAADAAAGGTVDAMLAEAHRVLRVGGRHIIVSLCQRQVVDKLLEHIALRPWIARIHQVTAVNAADPTGFPLPVFFIALTKLRGAAVSTLVQAQDAYSTGPPERLESAQLLADWIRRAQLTAYSLARPGAAAGTAGDSGGSPLETRFAYACGRTGFPAFACRLLTHASPSRRRDGYAVFLEPLGLSEPTTLDQRWRLLESQASLRRLLFVRLHPWLYYESDAALQASLSRLVMAFAPRAGMSESAVPFISSGQRAYPYSTQQESKTAGGCLAESSETEDDPGELRLVCPDSDLAPLQCRVTNHLAMPVSASDTVHDCLSRFLDALLKDPGQQLASSNNASPITTASAAFVGWPCDLDWLLQLARRGQRMSLHRPITHASATLPVLLDLLADRCGLDYRSAEDPPLPCRLVVLFPPAYSLAAYSAAMSPESLVPSLADSVDVAAGGRLVLVTRLFDAKRAALDVNASAVACLRQCGRFARVVCATVDVDGEDREFNEDLADGEDREFNEDLADGEGDRLRYWVVCASGTSESAERAVELLTALPGASLEQEPPPGEL